MAARELRYQWFNTLKEEHTFTHLLTAHHLDDQLETFLINLGRGSGIKGLSGIPDHSILRPLLTVTKRIFWLTPKKTIFPGVRIPLMPKKII